MWKDENFPQIEDVKDLYKDLSGLNEVYREIADEIGIENTIAIYRLFHGTQISFPNRLFSKEYIRDAIVREFNGKNVPQLAQKYKYSQRTIWRILQGSNHTEAGSVRQLQTEQKKGK